MTVTVAKGKKATVVSLKSESDSESMFPPLCQILGILCYSPTCCTVHKRLMQTNLDVVTALATIQIMVGLFNIGLGPGRTSTHPGDLTNLRAAYWLGAVYMIAGIISLLAYWFTFICLVGFAAFVNIVGSIFAIIGVVLYAIDLSDVSVVWMCNDNNFDDNCRHVAYFAQSLLTGMDVTLIVLAVLELCVCISLAVLCITALVSRKKEEVGGGIDSQQSMLKEVMTNPGKETMTMVL